MRRLSVIALLLVVAVLAGPVAAPSEPLWAGSPTDAVRRHMDEMISVAVDRSLTRDDRREAARAAVTHTFDFVELSRRALGEHWSRMTVKERDEVTQGLRTLLTGAYAAGIGRALGAGADALQHRVRFVSESVSGNVGNVQMRVSYGGRDLPLAVSLMRHGRGWRIWDLTLDGFQLTDNIRAQITHLSRGGDYHAVLERLRVQTLLAGG
jgi:phospholipid transport system substrate-binding protein